MNARFKIFLFTFILSLPFWLGMNLLEKNLNDFFFWHEVSKNPQIFTAQISLEETLENIRPVRNGQIEDLEIKAKSAISLLIKNDGRERILFEKNTDEKLAIASLTKLMTALVVLENYDLSKEIKITKEAIDQEEDFGKLQIGKIYPIEYLLYPLLMESSNDAAFALSNDYEGMEMNEFVQLMNLTAESLELRNTYFFNPSGLEPDQNELKTKVNYSNVGDLSKLTKTLLGKPLIWEILSTPTYNLYGPELKNTNELLFDQTIGWQDKIIGGKTGYADKAGGCMVLVLKAPENRGLLINVILGSNNGDSKFQEMKKLVDWLNSAYRW